MPVTLRPMQESDMDAIVELSLLAWEPVFDSFQRVLGSAIFSQIYPDWKRIQADVVESLCRNTEKYTGYVAERDGAVVGFILYRFDEERKIGEVELLAVHPAHQRRGVATLLNTHALEEMKAHGMRMAEVGTGGDPGHAPARAAYEKAGYDTHLTVVRYYKMLVDE